MVKTGAVMTELGSSIAGAALAPVEATFETRRALGELASLGVKDLEAVEDAARGFSDQWAGTSKADFISASYDIKSGIASLTDEGVADFTTLAALTGKATKSTVGEMTSLFATGYGIYKGFYDDLTDLEFGEMFSAGISKSVQQFKTTGSEMAAAIESLGASATNAKVPLEEAAVCPGDASGHHERFGSRHQIRGLHPVCGEGRRRTGAGVRGRQQPDQEPAGDPGSLCVESTATPSTPSRSRRSPRHSAPMRP